MKNQGWQWTVAAVLIMGLVTELSSPAQSLPLAYTAGSGSTSVDFEFRLDGTLLEKGMGSTSTLSNADLQASSVFLWYPIQSALRAGGASTETVGGIGQYSVALGEGNRASGTCGIAMGCGSGAGSSYAIAMGFIANAGFSSSAIGEFNSANGYCSGAFGGYGNSASNSFATAFGALTLADGTASTSTGQSTVASGTNSASFGLSTLANSLDSAAFGQFNLALNSSGETPNPTSWVSTDPLFEIGNGTATAPSDALVVYKNGNATLQGSLTVAPSGDIPMYTGN